MAARYWVGGAGAWDSTNTTNWSATSGGAGGASVPTSADTISFDTNSGTGTVTFTNGAVTVGAITHTAPNITLSLGAAIISTNLYVISAGGFITNGYSVTGSGISVSGTTARTINFGSSLITLTSTATAIAFSASPTVVTFNAGTSSIVCSGITANATLNLGGFSFYDVSFTSTAMLGLTLSGANTFHNLSFVGTNATVGILSVLFGSNQTITGTFSVTGTTPIKRVFFYPVTTSRQLSVTLNCNAVSSIDNCDFYEVNFTGNCISGGNITGTSVGDGGGNSGITFSTPKTVYWVGASGAAWYSANWATSSGGTGAAANMPLPQDTMIIDNFAPASGGTVGPGASARAVAGAINFSARTLPVTFGVTQGTFRNFWFGSMTISSAVTLSVTNASFYFTGATAKTLISAGKTFPSVLMESLASGSLILGDALTSSSVISLGGGEFNSAGYALSATGITSTNATASKTLTLGSSVISLSGDISITTGTSAIVNGGTSVITFTGINSGVRALSGYVYNLIATTAPSAMVLGGIASANNITFPATATAGVTSSYIQLYNDFTINGTLTIGPSASILNRTFIRSSRFDTVRNISINAVSAGLANLDFSNIAVTGAAAPLSGTNFGNCGGNSGITFPSPKTVYWNLAVGGNWSAIAWATSVGGIPSVNNFPLAQDTAVFAATGLNSGATVTNNTTYNMSTVDMSLRTGNSMTFSFTADTNLMGNWINGTGTTISGTQTIFFKKNGTQTITGSGKTFTTFFNIEKAGSLVLQSAVTSNNITGVQLVAGTLNLNGYVLTTTAFSCPSAYPGTIDMNSGTLVCTDLGNCFAGNSPVNTTFIGTGIISLTSASNKTFNGGGVQTYPTLNQGGTGALTISGSNKFADITNTAIGSVLFTGGTTNEFTAFNLNGAAGNLLTLGSTTTTQAILKKATAWNVGVNSTNGGNNTGLSFTGTSPNYLSVSYINGQGVTTSKIYYGSTLINTIKYGSTPVTAVYYGSIKVFG